MQVLICRETQKDGSVLFVTYDTDTGKCSRYTNNELMVLVAARKIFNAKLENSVIKMTDGKKTVTLSADSNSEVYYIFETYISPNGLTIYAAVNNHGVLAEFSDTLAELFFSAHKVANASLTKKGIHMTRVPTFSSPLQKSLEHINIH